jgi:hypothetical protein
MGSEELAANMFRATQADAKLRRESVQGKDLANQTHLEIGKIVRRAIAEAGGTMPENLPTPDKSIQELQHEEQKQIEAERQPSLFNVLTYRTRYLFRSGNTWPEHFFRVDSIIQQRSGYEQNPQIALFPIEWLHGLLADCAGPHATGEHPELTATIAAVSSAPRTLPASLKLAESNASTPHHRRS